MSAETTSVSIPWRGLRFGLGLLEIGRPWGAPENRVPDRDAALRFLAGAHEAGVRLFDTAASYGDSEARFGAFLRTLSAEQKRELVIATKFGEHWDDRKQAPYDDHSYDALCRSLDRSYERLGRVDVLQVHKSSPEVLRSRELHAALDEAERRGVKLIGASTSDPKSGEAALETGRFAQLQMPYSLGDQRMAGVLAAARDRGLMVFTNRPFQIGKLLDGSPAAIRGCIEAVVKMGFDGSVLFGTRSLDHLRENMAAFHEVSGQ